MSAGFSFSESLAMGSIEAREWLRAKRFIKAAERADSLIDLRASEADTDSFQDFYTKLRNKIKRIAGVDPLAVIALNGSDEGTEQETRARGYM